MEIRIKAQFNRENNLQIKWSCWELFRYHYLIFDCFHQLEIL